MRILRRVGVTVATLLVLVIAAGVGVYIWQAPILMTATGYAAHNACAVTHVAGRDDPESDLPDNPLVPYLSGAVEGPKTTASIEGLVATQTAYFVDGFGCTLGGEAPSLPNATPVSAANNPLATQPAPTPISELETAIDLAFGADLSDSDRAALGTRGVVVVKDGQIVAERYADGFTRDTPQLGWSMTKSVASLLTGVLVKEGKVALDDDNLRPEWTDARAAITVEDLMRMQSGLEWDETYDLGTPITRMLYLESDMARYVASLPLEHEPGTFQEYSSGSTNLLCDVLVERSGLGADLPRAKLFAPLGLSTAVMETDGVGLPVCSSYMWASPRDWAAIGQFALTGGEWNGEQLLPTDWMTRSLEVTQVAETDDPGYALGWRANTNADGSLRNTDLPADAFTANGHDGQRITVIPSEQLVVVRLGFTPEYGSGASVDALVQAALTATR